MGESNLLDPRLMSSTNYVHYTRERSYPQPAYGRGKRGRSTKLSTSHRTGMRISPSLTVVGAPEGVVIVPKIHIVGPSSSFSSSSSQLVQSGYLQPNDVLTRARRALAMGAKVDVVFECCEEVALALLYDHMSSHIPTP